MKKSRLKNSSFRLNFLQNLSGSKNSLRNFSENLFQKSENFSLNGIFQRCLKAPLKNKKTKISHMIKCRLKNSSFRLNFPQILSW